MAKKKKTHRKRQDTKQSGKRKKGRKKRPKPPALRVRLGKESHTMHLDRLADGTYFDHILQRCTDAKDKPQFVINDLLGWSNEARSTFFGLVRSVAGEYAIRFAGGDTKKYCNLFDAALHCIEGGKDLLRSGNSKRAVLHAAAICHPDALEIACSQIAERFRELGVKNVLPQTLLKEAKGFLGQQEGNERPNAKTAAEEFLEKLELSQEEAGHPDGEFTDGDGDDPEGPILRYFRQEFYLWDGRRWKVLQDDELEPRLVGILQRDIRFEDVGVRLVRDVITNLRGMVLLDCWDQQMPLWIKNEVGPVVEPSPFIVFHNGMVDMEEALEEEDEPELHPFRGMALWCSTSSMPVPMPT